MQLYDIHTHRTDSKNAIINCNLTASNIHPCSVGIHPWEIADNSMELLHKLKEVAESQNVVAIGECGFDFIKGTATKKIQQEIFAAHIALSEELNKPLIIHSVKAEAELLDAARQHKHKQAWIVHGFRGKPQQAANLLKAGMYLSYGEHFNHESLGNTPPGRLFIESDESNLYIIEIYDRISKVLGISCDLLAQQIAANIRSCNIKL